MNFGHRTRKRACVGAALTPGAVLGLHATTAVTGGEPTARLLVESGDSNDDVSLDPSATALVAVSVDLGTGPR